MQRKLDQGGIDSGVDLAMIAGEGGNQHLIGILIRWGGTQDEKAECVITCLHRDPEWVGINPLLEYCLGLETHLLGETDNGPWVVIATTSTSWR